MPRLMSFAHTVEQIRAGTKTVTRRLGWENLRPGERFWAVERLRGLKKGSHVKRLALLECVSNRREPIAAVLTASVAEISKEGFPAMGPGGVLADVCLHQQFARAGHFRSSQQTAKVLGAMERLGGFADRIQVH